MFYSSESHASAFQALCLAVETALARKGRDTVTNLKDWPARSERLLEPMPEHGVPLEQLIAQIDADILDGAINFSASGYLGFPDAANSVAAMAGALITDLVPQNLVNSRRWAPTATFVEIATVLWLRRLVGYDVPATPKSAIDVAGFATPGGVLSNVIGLLVARENLVPGSVDRGYRFATIRTIIPQHIDHYSIRTAVGWLGMGRDSIIRAPVHGYRYDLDQLATILRECTMRGERAIVVAYAGDSRSLTVDNLESIADLCATANAWFHVDACHGFQLAFAPDLAPRLRGIERADSLTADPHKVLWVPHTLSYVLFRKPALLKPVVGASDLVTTEDMSLGSITPFLGTRRFDALKLWCLVKNLGSKEIGRLINERHRLAILCFDRLRQNPRFVVLSLTVDINGVMFVYVGKSGADSFVAEGEKGIARLNGINWQIHEALLHDGNSYVHTFQLPDLSGRLKTGTTPLQVLRFMCGNPKHTPRDIDNLINRIDHLGSQICLNVGR